MNLNNILKYSALSMALVAIAGCTKEVDYDPAAAMTNAQVFFADDAISSVDLANEQDSFTVYASRVNTSGALTVDLESYATVDAAETNIFTVPSTVTFADGEDTAPITVTFDFNEIKANTTYSVTLDLVGESLTPYGKSEQIVEVQYAPWSEWVTNDELCTFVDNFWYGSSWQDSIAERYSLLNPDLVEYRIQTGLADEDYPMTLELDKSTNYVRIPLQNSGLKYNGYTLYIVDTYTFFTDIAVGDPEPYEKLSYLDPETGYITLNICPFFYNTATGGLGWFGDSYYDYVQLPGYPDYNVSMSSQGTYISESNQEYTIIETIMGSDVASYAITLKEGYLSDDEVQSVVDAIIADTETTLYTESRQFQFPVYEEDYYTCITVSYGSDGEPKGSNVYRFYNEINQVDWNYGWTTVTTSAEFYDVFFAGYFWGDVYSWEVEVQQSDSYPGYYRIVKPYGNNIYGLDVERGHYYVYVDARNPNSVVVYPSFISYVDYPYYVASNMSKPGKMEGTKITFPANSLGLVNSLSSSAWTVLAYWSEEATLIDFDPQPADNSSQSVAKRRATPNKVQNKVSTQKPLKNAAMPYDGKKIEKKLQTATRRVK